MDDDRKMGASHFFVTLGSTPKAALKRYGVTGPVAPLRVSRPREETSGPDPSPNRPRRWIRLRHQQFPLPQDSNRCHHGPLGHEGVLPKLGESIGAPQGVHDAPQKLLARHMLFCPVVVLPAPPPEDQKLYE